MKIALQIFLVCLFATGACNAQATAEKLLKELHEELRTTQSDTAKAMTLVYLGTHHIQDAYFKKTPNALDSAMFYAKKAETLANTVNYKKAVGKCYIIFTWAHKIKAEYNAAESYAKMAVSLFNSIGDKEALGEAYMALAFSKESIRPKEENIPIYEKAYNRFMEANSFRHAGEAQLSIGYIHNFQGRKDAALVAFNKVIELYDKAGHGVTQHVYSQISGIYQGQGNYEKALEYGLKGIRIAESLNDRSAATANIYYRMGTIYTEGIDRPEEACFYLKKAHEIFKELNESILSCSIEGCLAQTLLELKRNKEALYYIKLLEDKCNHSDEQVAIVAVLRCLQTYTVLKDFKNAEKFLPKAEQLFNHQYFKPVVCSSLAQYYLSSKNYDKARFYANAEIEIYTTMNNPLALEYAHTRLHKIDSIQSHYQASLYHLKKQYAYADTVNKKTAGKEIDRLYVQHAAEKKKTALLLQDKKQQLLKSQAQLQESNLTKATIVNATGFGLLVLLLIIAGLIYRRYQLNQRIRAEINLKNSTLQSLLNEKEWLLKEIHHRVKNNLQIVMSLLNTQSHFLSDAAAKAAIKNSQHRIYSMSLIHKKLYQSDNVVSINMQVYINELIEYFKQSFDTGQRIRFEADIEPVELKTSQAVPLGLILNEAIINAIKHAFPADREGLISITLKNTSLNNAVLTIKDNGVGMSANPDDKTLSSLGLKLIRGFSGKLNGHLAFANNNGLAICLKFSIYSKIPVEEIPPEKVSA
ncbi:tetratricopeptide repeat protein [Flavobacterium zepuense]|uniref:histidine kinase n=1 Tax=Flavobacterium zepuense TaxID=2593302 RepID=A0A552VAL9_9FLAO|nr:histidine kinase dimerization/phosphoacceptor domain -containing protein [Flavobacterium zepuense]TRW27522.1 tetratricopeptide repeat protein [Flavobacterium zepuense]